MQNEDLYEHFLGAIEVTIHSCDAERYAAIIHRTPEDAKRNLHQPVDHVRLGWAYAVSYPCDQLSSLTSIPNRAHSENLNHSTPALPNVQQNSVSHSLIDQDAENVVPSVPTVQSNPTERKITDG